MRNSYFISIIVVLVAALTAASTFAQTGLEREIRLKKSAAVRSQRVCLGDLVEDSWIQGRCAVDQAKCCLWSMSETGYPKDSESAQRLSKVFSRIELQRDLAKTGFQGFSLKLTGSDEVEVVQTHRELRVAEIKAKIHQAILKKWGSGQAQTPSVQWVKLPRPVHVPLDREGNWDVALPEGYSNTASIKITLINKAEGSTAILGWVQAGLALHAEVYVANRNINPMQSLNIKDFSLRRTDVLSLYATGAEPFLKGKFPIGVRAKQTIWAGNSLSSTAIERSPIVRLGDTVTLILRSDNLRISTKGIVQGSAAVGDMVTVQLSRYNRTFRGKLLDGRFVEVWL